MILKKFLTNQRAQRGKVLHIPLIFHHSSLEIRMKKLYFVCIVGHDFAPEILTNSEHISARSAENFEYIDDFS